MTNPFVKFAFSAGVLSPAFLARPDLDKFDLGLREGENWTIDYRGGATVRSPLEFVEYLQADDGNIRLVKFEFNRNLSNTYVMVFGHEYLRFLQNGEYITESGVSISSISNVTDGLVTTTGAHGYTTGDFVKLVSSDTSYAEASRLTFSITVLSSTTFTLNTPDGAVYPTASLPAFSGSATVERIYTVVTPYDEADLFSLVFDQYRDEVRITSTGYKPRKLVRTSDTNWSLTEESFSGNEASPAAPTITPSATASSGVAYAVTAVNADGVESYLAAASLVENSVNITVTAGSVKLTWAAVTGAIEYRVYRTIFTPTGADITFAQPFGYIGQAYGPQFIDNNIIPDFTLIPPIPDNPFADGAVLSVQVTAGGSGYAKGSTTVSITGGTGFVGLPIVNDSGAVIAVRVLKAGSGYSGGSLTFGGAGTGATATFVTSPAAGNNPAATARIQQRQIYAGTENLPMTLFGSRPGYPADFSFTLAGTATDAFDLSIDSPQLTPIKYLTKAQTGFFVFTEKEIFQVRGTDDSIISGLTAISESKSELGCGDVPPIRLEAEILFVQEGSLGVRGLRPSNLPNYYENFEVSLYSSHYFEPNNFIVSWTHARSPDRLIYAVRNDGSWLTMTYVPEQNVYAWSDANTRGKLLDVESITEGNYNQVYAVVERTRGGAKRKYIEKFVVDYTINDETIWAIDSVYQTPLTPGAGSLTAAAATGSNVLVTVTGATPFTSGDVGKHIRFGNGRALIVSYISSTQVTVNFELPVTDLEPQTKAVKTYTMWTIDSLVSEVSGLWHLEGQTVQVLADGGTEADKVVSAGTITLDNPASYIVVGLPYTGDLATLPLKSEAGLVFDKKKRPVDVSLRLLNSRGLSVGARNSNKFYDLKERFFEDYGVPPNRKTGISEAAVTSDWSEDAGIIIRKDKPLRATVLGFVLNAEVGLD